MNKNIDLFEKSIKNTKREFLKIETIFKLENKELRYYYDEVKSKNINDFIHKDYSQKIEINLFDTSKSINIISYEVNFKKIYIRIINFTKNPIKFNIGCKNYAINGDNWCNIDVKYIICAMNEFIKLLIDHI